MPQAQVVLYNGIDFHTAKRAARRRNHAAKGSSVKFSVFRPYFDTLERMARIGILQPTLPPIPRRPGRTLAPRVSCGAFVFSEAISAAPVHTSVTSIRPMTMRLA